MAWLPAAIPSPSTNVVHVGPFTVHIYGLCYVLAVLAAVSTRRRWAAGGGSPELVYDVALWGVPAGIVGGRLYFDSPGADSCAPAGEGPAELTRLPIEGAAQLLLVHTGAAATSEPIQRWQTPVSRPRREPGGRERDARSSRISTLSGASSGLVQTADPIGSQVTRSPGRRSPSSARAIAPKGSG
jgi:Prolipoprotein diacylglyceryl transferase